MAGRQVTFGTRWHTEAPTAGGRHGRVPSSEERGQQVCRPGQGGHRTPTGITPVGSCPFPDPPAGSTACPPITRVHPPSLSSCSGIGPVPPEGGPEQQRAAPGTLICPGDSCRTGRGHCDPQAQQCREQGRALHKEPARPGPQGTVGRGGAGGGRALRTDGGCGGPPPRCRGSQWRLPRPSGGPDGPQLLEDSRAKALRKSSLHPAQC